MEQIQLVSNKSIINKREKYHFNEILNKITHFNND